METLETLRAALSQLCEDAIYQEAEESGNPCPYYLTELLAASRAIGAAQSLEDLAGVPWIERKAALAADHF